MTEAGELRAANSADTEVFYMAGRQLPQLSTLLQQAGWPAETPALVVSRARAARCAVQRAPRGRPGRCRRSHAERPTIVVVGAGDRPCTTALAGQTRARHLNSSLAPLRGTPSTFRPRPFTT